MIVNSLQKELQHQYIELQTSCQNFLDEINQICEEARKRAIIVPQKKKSCWNYEKRNHMQANLKKKFSQAIQTLKKEFQERQKKGKLPSDATDLLKYWWEKNFHWPYPTVSSIHSAFKLESNF